MKTYRMWINGTATDTVVQSTSPTAAVRAMCEVTGMTVATQDGRYVKTTDGQNVTAMVDTFTRARYSDHGTTRV